MGRLQNRNPLSISNPQKRLRRSQPGGDNKTADRKGADSLRILLQLVVIQLHQVGYLGIAQDLNPGRVQVVGVTGQGQSGLLDP